MNVLVWNELDMMLETLEVHKMMFSLLMNVFTASLLSIFCDRRPLRLGVPNPIVARYEYNLSLRCTFWKSNSIYFYQDINLKLNHILLLRKQCNIYFCTYQMLGQMIWPGESFFTDGASKKRKWIVYDNIYYSFLLTHNLKLLDCSKYNLGLVFYMKIKYFTKGMPHLSV